jgi:hypothetical protein
MRKLFLHVGTHKTGTTALQHYLFSNQESLRSIGWYYPKTGIPHGHIFGHRDLAWSTLRGNSEALEDLASELNTLPSELKCVISSEEFEFCEHLDSLKARLKQYDVTVVLYLRRQDDLLLSAYSENLRGKSSFAGSLTEFERRMSRQKRFDYVALCQRWSEAFGYDKLIARIYSPAISIVDDFCTTLGIDFRQLLIPPKSFANASIDARLSGAFRMLNQLRKMGLDEATGSKILNILLEQDKRLKSTPKKVLMTPRERVRYLKRYQESNNELSHFYLQGESFANPLEENAGEVKVNPELIERATVLEILETVLISNEHDEVSPLASGTVSNAIVPSMESIFKLARNLRKIIGRTS